MSEQVIDPKGKNLIYAALSKAQGEYPSLVCDGTGMVRGSKVDTYASLDQILSDTIRKINAKYGLCVTITPDFLDNGKAIWIATLGHESGQEIVARAICIATMSNEQHGWAGANTYQVRYLVKNLLGLSDKGEQKDIHEDEKQPSNQIFTPQNQPLVEASRIQIQPNVSFKPASQPQIYRITTIAKNNNLLVTDIIEKYGVKDINELSSQAASDIIGKYK